MLIKVSLLLVAATLVSAGRVPHLEQRILGGQDTPIQNDPWVVAVLENGEHFCGGAIYRRDIIITAAHCIAGKIANELQVRVGSPYRSQGGTVHQVAAFRYHAEFSIMPNESNDIAVIQLCNPVIFSDRVQSIPLADEDPEAGSVARSTGWGCKNNIVMYSEILQSVEIPILSERICQEYYGLPPKVICAGAYGKSICYGDSGGPLTVDSKLVGIAASASFYTVGFYLNVVHFKDWIENAVESLSCTPF